MKWNQLYMMKLVILKWMVMIQSTLVLMVMMAMVHTAIMILASILKTPIIMFTLQQIMLNLTVLKNQNANVYSSTNDVQHQQSCNQASKDFVQALEQTSAKVAQIENSGHAGKGTV